MVIQGQKEALVDLTCSHSWDSSYWRGGATDLFNGKTWSISKASVADLTTEAEPHAVCLIHTTRLPPRHTKLVRARVDQAGEKSFTQLKSTREVLEQRGLPMGVAEPDTGGFLTRGVQNPSMEPLSICKPVLQRKTLHPTLPGGHQREKSHSLLRQKVQLPQRRSVWRRQPPERYMYTCAA